MAYITFVVLAGLAMGKCTHFDPSKPSIVSQSLFFFSSHSRVVVRHAKSIYTRTIGCYLIKCAGVPSLRIGCLLDHIVCVQHIVGNIDTGSVGILWLQIRGNQLVHFS